MFLLYDIKKHQLQKKVNCEPLFNNPDIDNPSDFEEPPHRIPKWLLPEYNYGGKVPISNYYRKDSTGIKGNIYLYWAKEKLDVVEQAIKNNTFIGPYGQQIVLDIGKIKYFKF